MYVVTISFCSYKTAMKELNKTELMGKVVKISATELSEFRGNYRVEVCEKCGHEDSK